MSKYELSVIANNIKECIEDLTTDNIINYVNDNFFTFSESERIEIINATADEFLSLPFC